MPFLVASIVTLPSGIVRYDFLIPMPPLRLPNMVRSVAELGTGFIAVFSIKYLELGGVPVGLIIIIEVICYPVVFY